MIVDNKPEPKAYELALPKESTLYFSFNLPDVNMKVKALKFSTKKYTKNNSFIISSYNS
jgi:hypothetical protein